MGHPRCGPCRATVAVLGGTGAFVSYATVGNAEAKEWIEARGVLTNTAIHEKLRKNLGRWGNLSAREIGHGRVRVRPLSRKKRFDVRFRALFAGQFGAKMQNGRSLPKSSDY